MFRKTRKNRGVKRSAPSRAGGKANMEYVFAGALAVIIVGALALTIYFVFVGDDTGGPGEDSHWKCLNPDCQYEFTMTPKQMSELPNRATGPTIRVDCPKCGTKDRAYLMIKCPKCGKYYVPDSHKYFEAAMQGQQIRNVCPYCKTDYAQWYRDNRGKKK